MDNSSILDDSDDIIPGSPVQGSSAGSTSDSPISYNKMNMFLPNKKALQQHKSQRSVL